MNRASTIGARVVLCGLTITAAGASRGQEKALAENDLTPRQVRRLKQESARPGPRHELLAPLAGRFRFRATYRFTPEQNPETAHGSAETSWILGGRFLESRIRGRRATRSYEGRLLLGFDNVSERYVGIWLDEMDSGIATLEGPPSEDGRTITFEAIANDPRFDGKHRRRAVLEITSRDRHVLRFSEPDPASGRSVVMAEIVFERRPER